MSRRGSFSPEAQRYLDGERDGETLERLAAAERASADQLAAALARYAGQLEGPGPELTAAVMQRIRREAALPGWERWWRWLVAPQVVRVRPAVLALAASLALVLWWTSTRSPVPTGGPSAAAQTVWVRFELAAPQAHEVRLVGSFNRWAAPGIPLRPSRVPGVWTVTIPLPVGEHQYLFVVDGAQWVPDPGAHAQVDDGFGHANSVIVVGPRGVLRS